MGIKCRFSGIYIYIMGFMRNSWDILANNMIYVCLKIVEASILSDFNQKHKD